MDNGSEMGLGACTAELWRPPNKASDSHRKRLWKLIYCGGFGEQKLFIFKDLKYFIFCPECFHLYQSKETPRSHPYGQVDIV